NDRLVRTDFLEYYSCFVSLIFTLLAFVFFFSSRRRHTRWPRDWSSDVCSSDLRGWTTRESAKPAQHLLAAAGRALVRAHRKGNFVRCGNGIAALGHHRHGNRPPSDSKNLQNGRTQSGCPPLPFVLARAPARQPALYRFRP